MLGAAFDCHSKFKVRIVCGNNLSHSFIEKPSATPANTEMKCPLNVWIACSAAFCLCWSAGVNSTLHLFSRIACFSASGALLLSTCQFRQLLLLLSSTEKWLGMLRWMLLLSMIEVVCSQYNFHPIQLQPFCTCFHELKWWEIFPFGQRTSISWWHYHQVRIFVFNARLLL